MNTITQSSTYEKGSPNPNANPNSNLGAFALQYTCLPSSTALSPNAHVTVAIRSFHTNIDPSKLKPSSSHKKNHDSFTSSKSTYSSSNDHGGMQLYVSTQILGLGSLPLHSNTVDSVGSTVLMSSHSSLTKKSHISLEPTLDLNDNLLACHFPIKQYSCNWDHFHSRKQQQQQQNSSNRNPPPDQSNHRQNSLTLPVRYKDLSHDASIKFLIHTSRNVKIGTVILPLWDEKKRLKMGLQKLKVKLEVQSNYNLSESSSSSNNNNNDNDKDEKWEACQILDKLNQIEKITMSKKDNQNHTSSTSNSTNNNNNNIKQRQVQSQPDRLYEQCQLEELNITVNGLKNCNSIQSIPWLDSLTKQYCMDVLNDKNQCMVGVDSNDTDIVGKDESFDDYSNSINVSDGIAYLVVELQRCDLPIVHHEQSYGGMHGGNSGGNGISNGGLNRTNVAISSNATDFSASGSITPLDLAIYHHQFELKHGSKDRNCDLVDDKVYVNGKVKQVFLGMPHLVHALDESHEHGMKQVQVLDFENINDNPVEDKYRTLQHELLRGVVDPALKPDASERSQLNAIINGTSQHLEREEKGKFPIVERINHRYVYYHETDDELF